MTLYVVGYIEKNSDRDVDYPVGVYDDEKLAEAAADKEWKRLKEDNNELIADAGMEEEDELADCDERREIEFMDNKIAVYVNKLNSKEELKGYFVAKEWFGSWWNNLEINKEI